MAAFGTRTVLTTTLPGSVAYETVTKTVPYVDVTITTTVEDSTITSTWNKRRTVGCGRRPNVSTITRIETAVPVSSPVVKEYGYLAPSR
ncbi:hypothetical protein V8F33_007345 [Rhypophila sp. PSN 637]